MKSFKTLAIGSLILATLAPVAATAQSRGEVRRDRQEIRHDQRDVRQAVRKGNTRDVREQKRDVRQAKRVNRDDHAYYRDYRARNRTAFRATAFRSANRYQALRPGVRIGSGYYNSRYYVNNWRAYRLPAPTSRQRWVRNYNDLLLVDIRSGLVIRAIPGFYW